MTNINKITNITNTTNTRTTPIIETSNLAVGFNNTPILSQLNFTIDPGQIVTILGGSGCGKTTLMRNLIGLEQPISGKIIVDQLNITTVTTKQRKQLSKTIGVMFQSGALLSSMSILDNVLLPLNEHSGLTNNLKREIALFKLSQVGLLKFADYAPASLSGGMIKRAAIARAMALDPSVLFLDEPSAGLDPITAYQLDELIMSLAQDYGITFVIVTHELTSIRRIANQALVLNQGKLVAQGSIKHLEQNSTEPFVRQFFTGKLSGDDK